MTPLLLAGSLVVAATLPSPVQAQSSEDIVRTIVQLADVVFRDGQPYYRHGSNERLVVGRDQYGRTTYYRVSDYNTYGQPRVVRDQYGRTIYYQSTGYGGYPYQEPWQQEGTTQCTSNGWCTRTYYDARYDRTRNGSYYYRTR